jgi:hypothetical protein
MYIRQNHLKLIIFLMRPITVPDIIWTRASVYGSCRRIATTVVMAFLRSCGFAMCFDSKLAITLTTLLAT